MRIPRQDHEGHSPAQSLWLHIPIDFAVKVALRSVRTCPDYRQAWPLRLAECCFQRMETPHMPKRFEVVAVEGMPEVVPGDDLSSMILAAANASGVGIRSGDVVVVAQKVVSKAEGAIRRLSHTTATPKAIELAERIGKDPRMVQIVMDESVRVVRAVPGVLIVETRHGLICANAGVDASNVPGDDSVTTLPVDPDASADRIRAGLEAAVNGHVAVIVSDSFNRPWREGSMNVAIGVSGLEPLVDLRGSADDHGRVLASTLVSLADEMASAAQIVMGETGRVPAAIIRGVEFEPGEAGAGVLLRPSERDLFR